MSQFANAIQRPRDTTDARASSLQTIAQVTFLVGPSLSPFVFLTDYNLHDELLHEQVEQACND